MSNTKLNNLFQDIANSIREKSGTSDKIKPINFPTSIRNIPSSDKSSLKNYLDIKKSCYELFSQYSLATILTDDILKKLINYDDTSNVTDMGYMFDSCSSLTTIPQLDTSNVTNMGHMFYSCSSLTTIPQLDTSNVSNMGSMFENCTSLTTIPQLDTSNVTYMGYMFDSCSSLTTIPQLDTSNVTNMGHMFYSCSSLTEINMINIGTSLNISATALEHDALVKLIGNLKAVTTTETLTMGSTKLALLSDEEKKVATDKGWVLA